MLRLSCPKLGLQCLKAAHYEWPFLSAVNNVIVFFNTL